VKKILGLTIAVLMVIGLIGAGTWAYFSDVETSTGNVFTAGTLDLKLTGGTPDNDSVIGTFNASTWAPGENISDNLTITNQGTIDIASLKLNFTYGTNAESDNGTVDTSGRPTYISGSPWTTDPEDYFDKMIKITAATWNGESLDGNGGKYALIGKTLFELRNGGTPLDVTLHATGSDTVPLPASAGYILALTFEFDSTATNGCQGNELTMKITVTRTQD